MERTSSIVNMNHYWTLNSNTQFAPIARYLIMISIRIPSKNNVWPLCQSPNEVYIHPSKKCQRTHPFAGKGWCWNPIWLNGIPTTLPYCIVWSLQRGARGLHYVTKMVVVGNLWVGISEIHQNAVVLKHCLVKCNSKSFPYVLFDPFKGGLEVHIMWPCLGKCNTKSFPQVLFDLFISAGPSIERKVPTPNTVPQR